MSVFSPKLQEQIKGYLGRYETKRTAIIPILHAIQDEYGWISDEQVTELHEKYDLHRVEVREVMTFYTLYHKEPPAKFEILFCDSIVCSMMGAREAIHKIEERIKEYKAAGKEPPFSVEGVPCLGVCDGAPALLVNKDRHLKVTAANVDEILKKYQP